MALKEKKKLLINFHQIYFRKYLKPSSVNSRSGGDGDILHQSREVLVAQQYSVDFPPRFFIFEQKPTQICIT